MATELATAYISLAVSGQGLRKQVESELGGVASAGDKAGKSLGDRVTGGFKKAAKVGLAAAGGVAAAALAKGFGRLKSIEEAQAKMRGLGHDSATVDKIMANALSSVRGTAFGLGEAATTAAGAVAAGIKPGQQLEDVLKSAANAAAAAGVGMDEMGSIYNKVASLGKAQNDVLQQVADRGIPIYQTLADQLGVTTDEVFKMASAGKIGFAEFEQAMTTASGTVAKEMGETFSGSMSNLWASLGRIGANVLDGVFEKLAPAAQALTDWLGGVEPLAKGAGEAIGAFLDRALEGAQALWDLVVGGDFSTAFREAFGVEEDHPIVGSLLTIRQAIIDTKDVASQFFSILRGDNNDDADGVAWAGPWLDAADRLRDAFDTLTGGVEAFRAAWVANDGDVTSSGFSGMMEKTANTLRDVFDRLGNVGEQILPSIGPLLSTVADAFGNVSGAIGISTWDLLLIALDLVSIALEALAPIISDVADYLADNEGLVTALVAAYTAWSLGTKAIAFGGIIKGLAMSAAGWARDTAATVANTASKVASKAETLALGAMYAKDAIIKGISTAATWAQTAATKALNLALRANPIGLIITAIMALIGVFVLLYNKNESFRELVNKVWAAIKNAIGAVVDWFKDTAWPWLKGVFDKIGEAAKWLWEKAIKPAWEGIKKGIDVVVTWLKDTAWPWIKDVWDKVAAGAKWLWENGIKPAWDNIKKGIEIVVSWLKDTAWPFIKDVWDNIAAGATWLWDNGIKPAFDNIKKGIDIVVDAFGKAKDAIGRAWDKLKDVVAGPIRTALGWINDYFIKPINTIFDKLGLSFRLPTINVGGGTAGRSTRGGPMLAMADGGTVPGWSPHARADNILAKLTAGEFILPVRSTARLLAQVGRGGMEMLRRGILPGYADGGFVGKAWDWLKDKGSHALDWAAAAASALTDPVGTLKRIVGSFVGDDSFIGKITGGLVPRMIDGAVAKLRELVAKLVPSTGAGWQQIWARVQSIAPEATKTSDERAGARTAGSGAMSMHAMGRAIDVVSDDLYGLHRKLAAALGTSPTELIGPIRSLNISRGTHRFGTVTNPVTLRGHKDHVHVAYADGGLVRPFVADSGVTLAPGLNLLNNKTGKPEPLARTDEPMRLHPDDVRALAAAVHRGALDGVREVSWTMAGI